MNQSELTEDQAAALGFSVICCCMVAVAVLVGIIVYAVVKRKEPRPGNLPANPPVPGQMHLSVLAIALTSAARDVMQVQLGMPFSAAAPALMRAELVRRVCSVLQNLEGHWLAFGYGEKDIEDLGSAEQSYRHALDDFRSRSMVPAEVGGTVAVMTLVLATRGYLKGVARLDDYTQIRAVIAERAALDASVLLGAELIWSPGEGAVSELTLGKRFPEMMRLYPQS